MFTDSETRKGFVEKVLGLVLLQLLATVAACALFRYWEPARVSFPLSLAIMHFMLGRTACMHSQ